MGKLGIIGALGTVAVASVGTATYTGVIPLGSDGQEQPAQIGEIEPEKVKPPEKKFELFSGEREPREKLSERDAIQFCLTLKGTGDECVTRKALLEERSKPLMKKRVALRTGDEQGADIPMKVMMAHPTDYQAPSEEVRSCDTFNNKKQEGWGAITSVDMVDEQWFMARCGLYIMAEKADIFEATSFADGRLATDDLEALPLASWPVLGEAAEDMTLSLHRPASNVTKQNNDRFWVARYGNMQTLVSEIAHADFDGDGEAEILSLMNARAVGGTARFSSYFLIEKSDDGVSLAPAETY
jgi:hypothetical protein